ncbi:MAG: hypothetical protein AADX96_13715, partial [Thiocapsa sp. C3-sup]|uniref:hypothetical protein n=1 Tax=Thiocapsa sp. C3-sup TaxID=3137396 RepID=UPI0035AFFD9B
PHTNGVGCAEPREAQPTVGASCASYRQHNLRVWKFAEITLSVGQSRDLDGFEMDRCCTSTARRICTIWRFQQYEIFPQLSEA